MSTPRPTHWPRRQISSRVMAGARARDTSPAKRISELSRHGMLLRSISRPSRILANRLTEERARLQGAEEVHAHPRNDPSTNPAAARLERAAARMRRPSQEPCGAAGSNGQSHLAGKALTGSEVLRNWALNC